MTEKAEIRLLEDHEKKQWDEYVFSHTDATVYHLSGWRDVIEKAYGHDTYYLVAVSQDKAKVIDRNSKIAGVLPLVHLKHFLFGNSLISMPYADSGGVLADSAEIEKQLIEKGIEILHRGSSSTLELRHTKQLAQISNSNGGFSVDVAFETDLRKTRMVLPLPDTSKKLFQSFKSKLRSQIRKPIKEGLYTTNGGMHLLDDFYTVMSVNMRDLGSPVHSKTFFRHVLTSFQDLARIVLVYKDEQPVACSLILGFRDSLANPWASALKEFSRLSPNMLLYWTMLEYACERGYKYFDFGRSTPEEGTYKFKEQWGAEPKQLHWYYTVNAGSTTGESSQTSKLENAIKYWQKMPVPVTRVIGPMIRKHIGL